MLFNQYKKIKFLDISMVDSGMDVQNKIMYSNKDYFEIVPKLNKKDAMAYKKYFENIKSKDKKYFGTRIIKESLPSAEQYSALLSECRSGNRRFPSNSPKEQVIPKAPISSITDADYFFWKIDYENSIIVANNITLVVFSDIINQLAMVLYWIFENKYSIIGNYYYRIGFTIARISIDNSKKIINHAILLDKINIDDLTNTSDSVVIEQLMDNGIKKINNGEQNNLTIEKPRRSNNRNKKNIVPKKSSYGKNQLMTNKNIVLEENTLIIQSMQDRLIHVENKMKSYDKFNEFLWKYCTVIGLLTAGSLLVMYTFSGKNIL